MTRKSHSPIQVSAIVAMVVYALAGVPAFGQTAADKATLAKALAATCPDPKEDKWVLACAAWDLGKETGRPAAGNAFLRGRDPSITETFRPIFIGAGGRPISSSEMKGGKYQLFISGDFKTKRASGDKTWVSANKIATLTDSDSKFSFSSFGDEPLPGFAVSEADEKKIAAALQSAPPNQGGYYVDPAVLGIDFDNMKIK